VTGDHVDVIVGVAADVVSEGDRRSGADAQRRGGEAVNHRRDACGAVAESQPGTQESFRRLQSSLIRLRQDWSGRRRSSGIGRALKIEVAAIVRQDHPVLLHGGQNDLISAENPEMSKPAFNRIRIPSR